MLSEFNSFLSQTVGKIICQSNLDTSLFADKIILSVSRQDLNSRPSVTPKPEAVPESAIKPAPRHEPQAVWARTTDNRSPQPRSTTPRQDQGQGKAEQGKPVALEAMWARLPHSHCAESRTRSKRQRVTGPTTKVWAHQQSRPYHKRRTAKRLKNNRQ